MPRRPPWKVVDAGCRLAGSRRAGSSVARPMLCSRSRCHCARAVWSCSGAVGRWSWGLIPLAARQTATSPMRVGVSGPPAVTHPGWVPSRRVWCRTFGEVDDQSGALGQVANPVGMILDYLGNAAEPGQWWFWPAGWWFREAPVEDGGHVSGGAEITPEGGLVEVDQGMLAGLGGQSDQVSTQGRPRRLVGDAGH